MTGPPPKPLGMSDFFALEAGEYLERLDGLLAAGARAFVAREGAAIASALDRAAQALRANPLASDPLQHVLRALQPLRGLAAVNDLPPLPDLLEGLERAIAELSRAGIDAPANVSELFQAGAT